MSFFDDASLVMIPSGYKTSKVYSVKPTDGTGDLAFTRSNDTATRVASNGLIEKVRTNLFPYSQTFANAAWTTIDVTKVSTSATDPNGGTTAANITWTSGSGRYFYQNEGTSSTGTISIWVKSNGGGNSFRLFANGATSFSSNLTATSTWTRYSFAFAGTGSVGIGITNASDNSAADLLVAFAQFETGDIATPYIATTTAAVSVGPVANVPRLDYLNSSCPRLLLEPQRTNVALYSEQINNAAWVKGNSPTITTNIATAPDGTISADGIQSADAANYKTIAQNIAVSANGTLTLSFFVKKETSETAFGGFTMYFQGGTEKIVYGIVNAVTGTVTYASSTLTATTKVESYGNYWRIASTATDNGSNTTCGIGYYGTLSANGTSLNTAAGSVRTIWGFQAEAASYATSYIPTLGAAVTRGTDDCVKTSATSIIGQTEGVVYFEWEYQNTGSSGGNMPISLDGGSGEELYFWVETSGVYLAEIFDGSVAQVSFTGAIGSFGTKKIAIAYKNNDFALYINGVLAGTDTSGTIPTLNRLYVGRFYANASYNIASGIKQVLLFPTRLSNADLAALTA